MASATILVVAALTSGAALIPTTGMAADAAPTTRVEVTLFGGYRTGGSLDQTIGTDTDGNSIKVGASLEKSASYGVALNWEAEESSFFELAYSRQATTLDATKPLERGQDPTMLVALPIDVTAEYLLIGGYVIASRPEARVVPYFVLTVGVGRLAPDYEDLRATTKFAASIGGGAKVAITEHIAVRFDARLYGMFLGNENSLLCGGSGGVTCKVHLEGDMLVQPDISLGFTYGF
jgi:hypothetical protein